MKLKPVLICVLGVLAIGSSIRNAQAESFTSLGRAMHQLDNALMGIDIPIFEPSPQQAIIDLKATSAQIRDNAATLAPDWIGKDPALLASFKGFFDQIIQNADQIQAIIGTQPAQLTEQQRARVKPFVDAIKNIEKSGHSAFVRPPAGPVVRPPTAPGTTTDFEAIGPIDRARDKAPENALTGDQPSLAHSVLWSKDKFIQSLPGGVIPPATAKADVVIVGGGMSGLVSAYQLKDLKPVLIEQAPRLGGNSRGESWNGIDYSIGSSYIDVPDKGSSIEKMLKDIGVYDKMRVHNSQEDPVYINNERYEQVWDNGTTPESKSQFNKLKALFEDMAASRNGLQLPQIPWRNPQERQYVQSLDGISLKAYLENKLGEPLHPDVQAIIDRYCQSAMGAKIDEVTAAAGLNFFVGDFNQVLVAPGGNAGIAEALARSVLRSVPASNIITGSLAFDIRKTPDGSVNVSYVGPDGKAKTINAKSVVVAAPKFVAAKIMPDLEKERLDTIKSLRYRSYLVANVLIDKEALKGQDGKPSFYDIFHIDPESGGPGDFPAATDVVYGNFANSDPNHVVLTLYRPIPTDNARPALLASTYDSLRPGFERQIKDKILPRLGIPAEKIAGIRISRWGHPIPIPELGKMTAPAGGTSAVDQIRAPLGGKIFFANQDNLLLPGFEPLFAEAESAAAAAREVVTPSPARAKVASRVAACEMHALARMIRD